MNLIIDGNNLAHRSFWISEHQSKLSTTSGQIVGCIYTFLNSIKSYAKNFNTNQIYIAWDKKLTYPSTNFRSELTKGEYKAQRPKEGLQSLFSQINEIESIVSYLGVKQFYPNIMEGDDVIAYLSYNLEGQNLIISVDQDLAQLISNKTSFYDINKKHIVDVDNFKELIGIDQKHFIMYKAILGDVSDNINGIDGYGKKKAKILAENWNPNSLTQEQNAIVNQNIKLIDLTMGYQTYSEEVLSYQEQLKNNKNATFDIDKFKEYCIKFEFKSYIDYIEDWVKTFEGKDRLSSLFT